MVKEPMNTRSPFTFDVWLRLSVPTGRERMFLSAALAWKASREAYRNMNRLPWFATYCPVPTR